MASISSLLQDGYTVNISAYLAGGRNRLTQRMPMQIMFGLLALLIITIVSGISSILPYVGGFIGGGFSMVLLAGYFYFSDTLRRGEDPEFGTFFEGFQQNFRELFLTGLVGAAITGVALLPFMVIMKPHLEDFQATIQTSGTKDPAELIRIMQELGKSAFTGTGLLMYLIGILVSVYFSVSYKFAPMLVIFNGLKFWDALETSRRVAGKNWGWLFLLDLVMGLLIIGAAIVLAAIGGILMALLPALGIILLLLGIIIGIGVMMSFLYNVNFTAFEHIFGLEDGGTGNTLEDRINEIGQ